MKTHTGNRGLTLRSKDFKIIQFSKIKIKELEAWTPVIHYT